MSWRFTASAEEFTACAGAVLTAAPVENTAVLTVLENVRAGALPLPPAWFAAYERDGGTAGAAVLCPPLPLLLTHAPTEAVAELAADLLAGAAGAADRTVSTVTGPLSVTEAFAAAWTDVTGSLVSWRMHERLYRLDGLRPLSAPPGEPRPATAQDARLATDWFSRFHAEAGLPDVDPAPTVRARIADRRLYLWGDPDGRPVAMAARHVVAAGVSRIGPVYTPPVHRRRGFGAAITATAAADALARGADHVVLFADLANPTSNRIYQRIGFVPHGEHAIIGFVPGRAGR